MMECGGTAFLGSFLRFSVWGLSFAVSVFSPENGAVANPASLRLAGLASVAMAHFNPDPAAPRPFLAAKGPEFVAPRPPPHYRISASTDQRMLVRWRSQIRGNP